MRKTILFLILLGIASIGFTEQVVLENQLSDFARDQNIKMAIQWANSAKDLEAKNILAKQKSTWKLDLSLVPNQKKTISLTIPQKAEYFRVVVWLKDAKNPSFITSWVDIIPNKIYTLDKEHLTPIALMLGTGC